jgi:hypothetical protein
MDAHDGIRLGLGEIVAVAAVLLAGYGVLASVIAHLWRALALAQQAHAASQTEHTQVVRAMLETHAAARADDISAILPVLTTLRSLMTEHNRIMVRWAQDEGDDDDDDG